MTQQRIVTVGNDGSETSAVALSWAAREAARRGAQLRVIHAYSVPVYGGDFGAAMAFPSVHLDEFHASHERMIADQLDAIRSTYPALNIETHVATGGPISMIVEAAKDAELVVVGSRGTGALAAFILGSVAHGVAHRAPCPVVLVPNVDLRPTVGRIVVGTDGSPAAGAAVDWADHEAQLWDAELTVAHVWQYPYSPAQIGTGGAGLMEVDAMRLLAATAHYLDSRRGHTSEVHARLLHGAPATTLISAADDSDLLVIGARGLGAFRSALLGSTSNHAIHHATCPIAVIHESPSD
jgi:nucleotide-binding universal stress UspA family protein